MTLLVPTNVTVSIYRTANPGSPYTLGALSATVRGFLKPAVQNGRFGSATWLKWTHILYLNPNVDIRDAYNSQLDPARDNTRADTVILFDSGGVNRVAYYVAFVEQVSRGTSAAHLRAYLDRFAPNAWPNNAL
jgi:hypothetical protein